MTRSLFLSTLVFCGAAFAAVLPRSAVHAQSKKEFSTARFYPAVGPGNFIGVEGAAVRPKGTPTFGAFFDYSADTLVLDKPCDGLTDTVRCQNKRTAFVGATGLVHLMAAVSVHDRVQLSLDLPLGFTDANLFSTRFDVGDGSNPSRDIAPSQGFAFADARVAVKTRIYGDERSPLAVSATAFSSLPTAMITSHGDCRPAGTCSFTGERGANAGANGIVEYRVANFRAAANLGAAYRPHRRFLTQETGTELLYGAAAQYNFTPLLHVRTEVVGAASFIAKDYPLEARGALSLGRDTVFMVGGGAGLVGVVGVPSYRVFAGAQYTHTHRDLDHDGIEDKDDGCPSEPEDRDGFMDQDGCPEPDNDGDGVPDSVDRCPNEPEDADGFNDEDGCPELDNDEDGVPDGYDSCEGQKEDIDGDKDDDGCPDFDTDRDGIDDNIDACPNEPEDTDGLADEDGCPETDYDGDGLPDTEDACPEQPESWNGVLDSDGCPEDDTDQDGVPDQFDQCEQEAETLNGRADADGCPDGTALFTASSGRLTPVAELRFDGEHLADEALWVRIFADFINRNHKKGAVQVVLTAPQSPLAARRAETLAAALAKRLKRPVSAKNVEGSPPALAIELGARATPAPAPNAPAQPAPAAAPNAPAQKPAAAPNAPAQKPAAP